MELDQKRVTLGGQDAARTVDAVQGGNVEAPWIADIVDGRIGLGCRLFNQVIEVGRGGDVDEASGHQRSEDPLTETRPAALQDALQVRATSRLVWQSQLERARVIIRGTERNHAVAAVEVGGQRRTDVRVISV